LIENKQRFLIELQTKYFDIHMALYENVAGKVNDQVCLKHVVDCILGRGSYEDIKRQYEERYGISDSVPSFNKLVREVHQNNVAKGFYDEPYSSLAFVSRIHSEVSEITEALRKGHSPIETYYGPDGKPEGIPSELADVILMACSMAGYYGINLDKAIKEKFAYNKTRPRKHGKLF